jgi:hypothetical protein
MPRTLIDELYSQQSMRRAAATRNRGSRDYSRARILPISGRELTLIEQTIDECRMISGSGFADLFATVRDLLGGVSRVEHKLRVLDNKIVIVG